MFKGNLLKKQKLSESPPEEESCILSKDIWAYLFKREWSKMSLEDWARLSLVSPKYFVAIALNSKIKLTTLWQALGTLCVYCSQDSPVVVEWLRASQYCLSACKSCFMERHKASQTRAFWYPRLCRAYASDVQPHPKLSPIEEYNDTKILREYYSQIIRMELMSNGYVYRVEYQQKLEKLSIKLAEVVERVLQRIAIGSESDVAVREIIKNIIRTAGFLIKIT